MQDSPVSRRFLYILLILLLPPLTVAAQFLPPHRKVAPAPRLTPAVERIRESRTLFRVQGAQVVLPTSVDNSQTRFFPPLIDQTGGSCAQAAGIGYMFTYEMNRLLQRDASLAENRMSYLFSWNMLNDGEDTGGFVEEGLQLARNYGIMSEADYGTPYLFTFLWATGYEKYERAMHNRAAEILKFDIDMYALKRYLYDAGRDEHPGGILTFSIQTEGWKFKTDYDGPSETGYHALLTRLGHDGGHALTIVGYDDLVSYTDKEGVTHTGAFIVCNSWGDYYYHDRGRFYLPYDFFLDANVSNSELSKSMNGVRATTYEPRLVCRVGLTYTARNELRYGMTTSQKREAKAPSTATTFFRFMNQQGGGHPMQGQYKKPDMEMSLDFSSNAPSDLTSVELYFLNIVSQGMKNKKAGEGAVTALQLIDYSQANPRQWPYRGQLPRTITRGNNYFPIPLRPRFTTSASPIAREDTTYLLRMANGQQAKFKIKEEGKIVRIKYSVLKK